MAKLTMESPTNRSVNKAEIWASEQVPFGLVRWKVEVVRQAKDGNASRDDYQSTSTFSVDMKIQEQGTEPPATWRRSKSIFPRVRMR